MTYLVANIYISGPRHALEKLFRGMDSSVFELRQARKAREDTWYIEFPSFRFSLLSLASELLSYVKQHETALSIERPSEVKHCILSLRGKPLSDGELVGFYLDEELINAMSRLSMSLDFDPDLLVRDAPRWKA